MGCIRAPLLEVAGVSTDSRRPPLGPLTCTRALPGSKAATLFLLLFFNIFVTIGIKMYMALSDLKARAILNALLYTGAIAIFVIKFEEACEVCQGQLPGQDRRDAEPTTGTSARRSESS